MSPSPLKQPSLLRQPVAPILDRAGIKYRTSTKGGKTWYNLKPCPACGKGEYECGVVEYTGTDGGLVHGHKCQHGNDLDYRDFLMAIGEDVPLRVVSPPPVTRHESTDDAPLNLEANNAYRNRLKANEDAMHYLKGRGLDTSTIDRFLLGLSRDYTDKKAGLVRTNALCYPIFNAQGQPIKKYANYSIPGVTINPIDENGWMPGSVRTYYADQVSGQSAVLICEGVKDLWRSWQVLNAARATGDLLLISSTHGSAIPAEWREPDFWTRFQTIYLGHDNDDVGEKIAERILRECVIPNPRRVRVPREMGKDWTDFFQSGGTADDFLMLVEQATAATLDLATDDHDRAGVFGYNPVDISCAYHNGHLYYPFVTMEREPMTVKEAGAEKVVMGERRRVRVVRSDGALLETKTMPAPEGTRFEDRILRLTDGTLIEREPAPSQYSTWSWTAIQDYVHATAKGWKLNSRPLVAIYRDVHSFLCNRIWLQHQEDYVMLSLAAIATYVQTVFDAVPLIMVNGPKGSGKTELGRAMQQVSANAVMIGQSSAATIARIIDSARGFTVLDDLEAVGRTSQSDAYFELIQGLKLSYKKDTAVKLWTDAKRGMRVERLNLYGIKMINNTGGVDAILGSRMLFVQTRKRRPIEVEEWEITRTPVSSPPPDLRNELHLWAFQNVQEVERHYRDGYPQSGDRDAEIAIPLRVIAGLVGDKDVTAQLEFYLARQASQPKEVDTVEELLEEALRNLVLEGYREIMTLHLSMEAQRIAPANFGQTRTTDIPVIAQPEVVGRIVRSQGWVMPPGRQRRQRLYGVSGRIMEIAQSFVSQVMEALALDDGTIPAIEPKATVDFCAGCAECPYRGCGCSMMEARMQKEAPHGKPMGTRH